MMGIIIVALAIGIAIYWQILENKAWNYLIEEAGKQARGKQREFIFVDEKRCQYCGKEISSEEYQRARHGYCDECSEDTWTEEEDYADKEEEALWGI